MPDLLLLTTIPDLSEQTVLNPAYFLPVGIVGTTQKLSLQTLKTAFFTDSRFIGVPTTTLPLIGDRTDRVASTVWVGSVIGSLNLGLATATASGTVKTNSTDPVPTVYLKSEVDDIAASVRSIASGGTGASTAAAARANLGAAASGTNNDITAVNSLNTIPGIISSAIAALVPVGCVLQYAGSFPPNGWLLCDGAEYLRSNLPLLYAVIGTLYGVPTDSTKFKVPDFRDRSAAGSGVSGLTGTNKAVGLKTGVLSVYQDVSNMPNHSHGGTTTQSGAHIHNVKIASVSSNTTGGFVNAVNPGGAQIFAPLNGEVSDPAPIHFHNVIAEGSGVPIQTQSPVLYLNFIIKT
jgi:microcystin-dependent protein